MGRKVLVVDDDVLVLDLTATMLEELGYDVLTARSGTEALGQIAYDRKIEVLITDINMPGLSGSELAERVVVSAANSRSSCYPEEKVTATAFR
jgi:CheY-like chemotaxis protein